MLNGDTMQVTADGFVSFMFSYPNLIPLSARAVQAVADAVKPFAYDRIYGAWWDRKIDNHAQNVVNKSVSRYLKAIADG